MDSPVNLLQSALVRAQGRAALSGISLREMCPHVTYHSCNEPGTSRNHKDLHVNMPNFTVPM